MALDFSLTSYGPDKMIYQPAFLYIWASKTSCCICIFLALNDEVNTKWEKKLF